MDQREETSLPASLVNGRLEGLSVPDLLWNLCRRRSTGVLHLTSRGITKRVYIDSGRIVFALSGDPNDRLGDLLLREGMITLDQLEAAILQLSSGKRLGAILVGAGHLSPDNLVRGVLSQVKGIVLALFPWEEGEYSFVAGPLPTEEVVTLGMRTAEILLQGIRQIRSFTRIRRSVGPPATRFRLDSGWRKVLDGLDIRDGERMLLQRLEDAGPRGAPVDAMCREVFLSNFEIYQALWAFLVLGVVNEVDGQDSRPGGAVAGRVERTTLPDILVRLAKSETTGVLHMSRGTIERTLHVKAGQCLFATSNAVDDGLVAHLLRRGVISLADREETARRLLSNKRVGTILLEMGVIDESDLRATVREQLSEIVFDTFRWDSGDFQFLEGELPTVEEITLTRSIEDLVFAGLRRITSWSRVREGCGGLGARLVLLPQYLSVLDRMTVGPEEWELISVLKTPKTVLEICRESVLGDFRSCQILWALRLLGGVGEAPLDVSLDSALGVFGEQPVIAIAPPASAEPEAEAMAEPETVAEPAAAAVPEHAPIPVSEADNDAEVISEPWRLAAERPPERQVIEVRAAEEPAEEPTIESLAIEYRPVEEPPMEVEPPAPVEAHYVELDPDPEPAPVEQAPVAEEPPVVTAPKFELDSFADATVLISREAVEAALRAPEDGLPKFEMGEPGSAFEDMKVDMPPAARPAFELVSDDEAVPETEAVRMPEPEETPEPAPAPAHEEAIDFNRTARLSREELEAALRQPEPSPAADASPAPVAPPPAPAPEPEATAWEVPADLDGVIASFNARHVVLFRAMRAEIGAGAANFVRSCRGALDSRFAEMFATAELRADGSWDPEGLRLSVTAHRIGNAGDGFAALLDGELEKLRIQMGEKRAAALADQLAAI